SPPTVSMRVVAFHADVQHRPLPPFPTRRSSDLFAISIHESAHAWMANRRGDPTANMLGRITLNPIKHIDPIGTILLPAIALFARSEEHTSELQSRGHLVCRLLLEKKKTMLRMSS